MEWSEEGLKKVILEVLTQLGGGNEEWKSRDPSGVLLLHPQRVACEPFQGTEGVGVRDLTELSEAPRMGAGVMEVERTAFPWTLTYDEFDVVVEGTLEIRVGERVYTGRPGDVFYIPKGTSISFCSPDKARYLYFVYPADWNKN